jgi:tetraacyldisaccharide 4'-kinase
MKQRSLLAKLILLPLSKIYGAAVVVRNKLFDIGILPQKQFDIPIVTVGNLAVGGTGKTPHTEYIISILKNRYKIGVLSRGYKRQTKGFVAATPHTTPRDIGDESYQIYHKFNREVDVAVCENRVRGIEKMREMNPDLQLIILDDAFQHRYVKPRVSIVLTEYDRPFYEDTYIPYGRLRDSMRQLQRADILIATKCPEGIKPIEFRIFEKKMDIIPAQSLFFSKFRYARLRPVFPEQAKRTPDLGSLTVDDGILAVSGIGNPRPFVRFLKSFSAHVKVNIFADHHNFTRKDMDLLEKRFDSIESERKLIITTEKDAVRLINNPYFPHHMKAYIFYLPVMVDFVNTEAKPNEAARFEDKLLRFILNKDIIKN